MPHLRHALVRGSKSKQFVGLTERRRHRLFNQHVNPRLHQGARHLQMQHGRHRDRRRMDFAVRPEHLLDRAERFATELTGNRVSPRLIRIDHRYQLHDACLLQLLIDARMIAPKGTHTNHRNIDRGFLAWK